jgi:hypothetical protein
VKAENGKRKTEIPAAYASIRKTAWQNGGGDARKRKSMAYNGVSMSINIFIEMAANENEMAASVMAMK